MSLHTAGLTNLTSLQLVSFEEAVNDEAALALASSLTGLLHLDLRGSSIQDAEAMQALRGLRLLTELLLDEDEEQDWQ